MGSIYMLFSNTKYAYKNRNPLCYVIVESGCAKQSIINMNSSLLVVIILFRFIPVIIIGIRGLTHIYFC